MYFYYDMNGRPYGLQYNGNIYYYLLNAQGDVIRMLDSTGTTVASYEYDPFGNIITATGTMAEANPLRYRGYYYDRETGFYYLNSRYYDPKIGRFINADSYVSTGQGIVGYNMFAYCGNNPVNMYDSNGKWPDWLTGLIDVLGGGLEAAVGAGVGFATSWTGGGMVAGGFLFVDGTAVATKGVGKILNDITNSNFFYEENIVRTGVSEVGRLIGGDTGAKIAGGAYDVATISASIYAGKVCLEQSMPKIINSKVFSANDGYGFKVGKNIEMFYRNPNAAGGPGGTIFSYKGPLGKFRIDWDPAHGFHCHPPGH